MPASTQDARREVWTSEDPYAQLEGAATPVLTSCPSPPYRALIA